MRNPKSESKEGKTGTKKFLENLEIVKTLPRNKKASLPPLALTRFC